MIRRRLLLAWSALSLSLAVSAQDIHFTLHDMSPMWLNPALTGAFEGTARIGGIYRGQWYTLDGITTPSFYLDAPIIQGFREQDWVGVGLMFIQDNASQLDLRTGQQALGASYHFAFDEERTTVLTLGGQYTRTSVSVEPGNSILLEETIDVALGGGGQASPTELNSGELSTNYTDFSAGLMLRTNLNETDQLEIGASLYHLTSPQNQLLSGGAGGGNQGNRAERPSTIHAHARLGYQLSEKWRLLPSVFFQTSAGNSSTSIQAWVGRQLKPDIQLRFGLGYRTSDSGKVLVGLDYKDLRAALAYDLTVSQASTIVNNQGAFELSAYYIIKIYKDPEIDPTILCPKL